MLRNLFTAFISSLFLLTILSSIAFLPKQAYAGNSTVTRGDAQAIFQSVFSGCGAVVAKGNLHEGQPCEDLDRAQLRLFSPLVRHYCADDWHVVRVTDGDTRDAVANFDAQISIDGQLLDTVSTPIKRFNPDLAQQIGLDPKDAFWINVGAVVPPSFLSVGTHASHVETINPNVVFDTTFEIDPSGTGACLL